MSDLMTFPETWEEFERSYGFADKDEVYTNGARLIPSFRVEQWLEHMQTQTADAVQVVRCKYCEHWKRHVGEIGDDFFCAFDQNKSFREDFFCADGERKDGEK